jgi:phosphoribosylformylglycinamidine synthase
VADELVASVHGVYRGGIGVHLALMAIGGNLGMAVELAGVPCEGVDRDDTLLFSESAGRFVVTVAPENSAAFEKRLGAHAMAPVGNVTGDPMLRIRGLEGRDIVGLSVQRLKAAWQRLFGDLI